jgi:hypothetical protein
MKLLEAATFNPETNIITFGGAYLDNRYMRIILHDLFASLHQFPDEALELTARTTLRALEGDASFTPEANVWSGVKITLPENTTHDQMPAIEEAVYRTNRLLAELDQVLISKSRQYSRATARQGNFNLRNVIEPPVTEVVTGRAVYTRESWERPAKGPLTLQQKFHPYEGTITVNDGKNELLGKQ